MNGLKRIYRWIHKLPKRIRDSVFFSVSVVGFGSTIFTVLGISLKDIPNANVWIRVGIVFFIIIVLAMGYYFFVGKVYKDAVTLSIVNVNEKVYQSLAKKFTTPLTN